MKKFFVIDFMAMAFRNFHAFSQNPLATSGGFPTSSIFGSTQFLLKLIQEEKPDYLVAACDSPEPTFRHLLYDQYKAHRKEMPLELAQQMPVLFRLFECFDIPVIKKSGVEADDIIGSIAHQLASKDLKVYIVSGDKDFMQLIDDDKVVLYAPKKAGRIELINENSVFEKFGVKPSQVIDVLALIGDSSDNVPGVPGIGEKGAAQLISQFGSLDGIYENLDKIANKRQHEGLKNNKALADLSKELVTIKIDLPLTFTLDDAVCLPEHATANPHLLSLMHEMEFQALASKIDQKIGKKTELLKLPDLENPYGLENQNQANQQNDQSNHASADRSNKLILPSQSLEREKTFDKAVSSEKNLGEEAQPTKKPLHRQNTNYTTVNDVSTLEQMLTALKSSVAFAFDTETTGLNIHDDKPIGFSFSNKAGLAWYVPCYAPHLAGDLTAERVICEVKSLLESSKAVKVAHNLKFDLQMCRNLDIHPCAPIGDTMLQAFVLDASRVSFGIDQLAADYLGIAKIPTSSLIGSKGQISMTSVELPALAEYACEDADCCYRLYELFKPMLTNRKLENVYFDIELPLVKILAAMELEGIFVNAEALDQISDTLDKVAKTCEKKIWELAGEEFNINSTKQLANIIFEKLKIHEKLGVKKIKKTQSGYSTDVSVMESLSEDPLPAAVLEYRTVAKLKNTYVDTLPQLIHPKTQRLHTQFHQSGTATGRLSSSNPNLQNIPIRSQYGREIRKAFQARDKNWVLLSADYSQIELRILAHLSGDQNLKKAFLSGHDIHRATAAFMFGKNPENIDSDERSRAKAINYGLIYGMGPQRLARDTGVSVSEAKGFIERYFQGFPNIKGFIENSVELARSHGYSKTITGRRRPIDGLDDPNGATAAYARNTAVNSPIQGSAADLIKIAMINLWEELNLKGFKSKILLQVHDELVLECPKAEVEMIIPIVKHCMENAIPMDVPLEANIGVGDNWLEAH